MRHTANDDGIPIRQQSVCATKRVLPDVVWFEGVVRHVVYGGNLCLSAILDLQINQKLPETISQLC